MPKRGPSSLEVDNLETIPYTKRAELVIEWFILATRWLLVSFYAGLGLGLVLYAMTFFQKLWEFAGHVFGMSEEDSILNILSLIDAALVASLVIMVIIAGYENYVSRFDNEREVHWLGEVDAGSLKIKVASTIVAISAIHLLQVFLNIEHHEGSDLFWYVTIHVVFVISALLLAIIDRVSHHGKSKIDPGLDAH